MGIKDKAYELSPEVKAGVEAEQKIAELNRQKREATSPSVTDFLEEKGIDYLEGYLRALDDQERLKQIQTAMALYYIHKNQLYKARGFTRFKDYCEARKINRSVAYEWVKNIEEFGIKDFVVLTDKIGLNQKFFREVKALPEEVKNAVVKGEKIEINDKEYDLSKDGKGLREAVKALVHEVNKSKLEKKAYDTHKTWNEKLAKKDVEIKRLQEQLDDKVTPLDDRKAIQMLDKLKIQLRGVIRIIEAFDPKKYSEEVKTELLLVAQFAHDRGELCLGRMLDELKHDRPALEEAEENFLARGWEKDDA